MSNYNTRQKNIIKDSIKSINSEFTIKELKEYLDNNDIKVGLTTIYREIEALVDNGEVIPIVNGAKILSYQYFEPCCHPDHIYLKCNDCGKVIHIDCHFIDDLSNHIMKDHNFDIDHSKTVLNGKCSSCIKKNRGV